MKTNACSLAIVIFMIMLSQTVNAQYYCPPGKVWGCHWYNDCHRVCRCVNPNSGWINENPGCNIGQRSGDVSGLASDNEYTNQVIEPIANPATEIELNVRGKNSGVYFLRKESATETNSD